MYNEIISSYVCVYMYVLVIAKCFSSEMKPLYFFNDNLMEGNRTRVSFLLVVIYMYCN